MLYPAVGESTSVSTNITRILWFLWFYQYSITESQQEGTMLRDQALKHCTAQGSSEAMRDGDDLHATIIFSPPVSWSGNMRTNR